jgi:hypothetical protein
MFSPTRRFCAQAILACHNSSNGTICRLSLAESGVIVISKRNHCKGIYLAFRIGRGGAFSMPRVFAAGGAR